MSQWEAKQNNTDTESVGHTVTLVESDAASIFVDVGDRYNTWLLISNFE